MDPRAAVLLKAVRGEVLASTPSAERLRAAVVALLEHLASPPGRTDDNCRTVDLALMNDDELWDRIDWVDESDTVMADVLRDMAAALHDTVIAPEVAANFESTPEQLLERLAQAKLAQ